MTKALEKRKNLLCSTVGWLELPTGKVPPLGRSAGFNTNRMECEVSRNASEIKNVREIDLMEGKSVMPPGKPTLCSLVSKNACLNPVWMARLTPCL
jgi:hypothetical protein